MVYGLDKQELPMLFVKDQRPVQGTDRCPVDGEAG